MSDTSIPTQPSASSSVHSRKKELNPSPKQHSSFEKPEVVAILGVSSNPDDFAYKVQRALAVKGHTPIPINPFFDQVDGLECYPAPTEASHREADPVESLIGSASLKPFDEPDLIREHLSRKYLRS